MNIFAEVTKSLYRLARKGVKFTREKEHEDSFLLLETRLLQTQILEFLYFHHPFVIDTTDASETALHAVLLQIFAGVVRPIAFQSRALSKTEVTHATM